METVNEQLVQAIKAAEDAAKEVEELKKQTRDADLGASGFLCARR